MKGRIGVLDVEGKSTFDVREVHEEDKGSSERRRIRSGAFPHTFIPNRRSVGSGGARRTGPRHSMHWAVEITGLFGIDSIIEKGV